MGGAVADLAQRGLLEKTMVVWMGEFGRTPRINQDGGRDHWPNSWSVVMGGGGMKGGQAIGATDKDGVDIVDQPVGVMDLIGSMAKAMGISVDTQYTTRAAGRSRSSTGASRSRSSSPDRARCDEDPRRAGRRQEVPGPRSRRPCPVRSPRADPADSRRRTPGDGAKAAIGKRRRRPDVRARKTGTDALGKRIGTIRPAGHERSAGRAGTSARSRPGIAESSGRGRRADGRRRLAERQRGRG